MVPCALKGIARFTFEQLCAQPLGAADYSALAAQYHTILLSNIPKMGLREVNEARRFITLVDELYRHHVKLVASAEAEPSALFPAAFSAAETKDVHVVRRCAPFPRHSQHSCCKVRRRPLPLPALLRVSRRCRVRHTSAAGTSTHALDHGRVLDAYRDHMDEGVGDEVLAKDMADMTIN